MDNLWDLSTDGIEDVTNEPVSIIQAQAGYLTKVTDSKVYADIESAQHSFLLRSSNFEEKLDECNFRYDFVIRSKYMAGYTSKIFAIYYSIPFYPIYMTLSEGLQNELREELNDLQVIDGIFHFRICSEKDLMEKLQNVFKTKYVRTILHTIIKIADNEIAKSKDDDLPF